MGKSSTHASLVGMTRNLQIGFVSPQFHIICDNKIETVMGGYEDNEAVTNHIWDVLVTGEDSSKENVIHTAQGEQQTIPRLHDDWLSTEEQDTQQTRDVKSKIRQKMQTLQIDPAHVLGSSTPVQEVHDPRT